MSYKNIEDKREFDRRRAKTIKRKAQIRKYHKSPKGKTSILSANLKQKYGIGLDEYIARKEKQDYRCAICDMDEADSKVCLGLDHNHTTGKLRKFLCIRCNHLVGIIECNPELVTKAQEYIVNESM